MTETAQAPAEQVQPGTEVAVRNRRAESLPAKLQYAKALAQASLLPANYRKQPANVLWALEYGEMLGLSPMAALTGVHVIEGKPTASAGLISALVRRAGHKLRVTGDDKRAVAEIIRCDDPDFTFRSEWTMKRAETAKLTGKDVWKKYPAAMLKARAITEVARDACEEALSGVHYTPEELGAEVDEDGQVVESTAVAEPAAMAAPQAAEMPAEDPFYVREAPEAQQPEPVTDEEWLAEITAEAASFETQEAGNALWRRVNEKGQAGGCTLEDGNRLKELIKARWAEHPWQSAAPEPDSNGEDVPQ